LRGEQTQSINVGSTDDTKDDERSEAVDDQRQERQVNDDENAAAEQRVGHAKAGVMRDVRAHALALREEAHAEARRVIEHAEVVMTRFDEVEATMTQGDAGIVRDMVEVMGMVERPSNASENAAAVWHTLLLDGRINVELVGERLGWHSAAVRGLRDRRAVWTVDDVDRVARVLGISREVFAMQPADVARHLVDHVPFPAYRPIGARR
jgi:hypothetical protein